MFLKDLSDHLYHLDQCEIEVRTRRKRSIVVLLEPKLSGAIGTAPVLQCLLCLQYDVWEFSEKLIKSFLKLQISPIAPCYTQILKHLRIGILFTTRWRIHLFLARLPFHPCIPHRICSHLNPKTPIKPYTLSRSPRLLDGIRCDSPSTETKINSR